MSHWIWKLLAWLLPIVATIGIGLWIYVKQSNKDLSYRVVSVSPLGPLQARGFSDLKLIKGDKPIEKPFLITIRLANTGDLDIRGGDFETPIMIKPVVTSKWSSLIGGKVDAFAFSMFDAPFKGSIQHALQVIDARVAATTPTKIPVEIDYRDNVLAIKPLLLNVGDAVIVEMLTSGDVGGVEISGRIAGIKEIREERLAPHVVLEERKIGRLATTAAFVIAFTSLLAAFLGGIRIAWTKNGSKNDVSIPKSVTIAVLFVFGLVTVILVGIGLLYSDRELTDYLVSLMVVGLVFVSPFVWIQGRMT